MTRVRLLSRSVIVLALRQLSWRTYSTNIGKRPGLFFSLRDLLRNVAEKFAVIQQQDASEFLAIVLDVVIRETNLNPRPSEYPAFRGDGTRDGRVLDDLSSNCWRTIRHCSQFSQEFAKLI
jgi:hypothetical protein